MYDPNEYINKLRSLSIETKQEELKHCREKATAAVVMHDIELAEYYLEVICYLQLFDIAEDRLDMPKRVSKGTPRFSNN